MVEFAYHRPKSLEEAWRLSREAPGARIIAGGTDLVVQMRKRKLPRPEALISLRGIPELGTISTAGRFRIGSLVTVRDLVDHDEVRRAFPELTDVIRRFGSRQIRNVATVGGNLCNASPAADLAPPFLAREAAVEIRGPGGERVVPLAEFFLGPGETVLSGGEILTAVLLDPPPPGSRAAFLRMGRTAMDLAIASVAVCLEVEDGTCGKARIAAGAVAPIPTRLREAEAALEGSPLSPEGMGLAAARAAEAVQPITDLRSTAEYRRHLIGVLVRRAITRIATDGQRS